MTPNRPPTTTPKPPTVLKGFKYDFVSTRGDARSELTVELKDRMIRLSYWATGVALGLIFIAVGLQSQHGTDSVFLILAGVLVLCALVLWPAFLWLSVPAPQAGNKVDVEIDTRGVMRRSDQQGEIFHTWFIFAKTIRTGSGLGLFFINQPPVWIPRRVFGDDKEMVALEKYLQHQYQVTQAAMRRKPV